MYTHLYIENEILIFYTIFIDTKYKITHTREYDLISLRRPNGYRIFEKFNLLKLDLPPKSHTFFNVLCNFLDTGRGGGRCSSLMMSCAGCDKPIMDKFLLNVLDRAWHAECVKCVDCHGTLSDKCYSRDGKILCKPDFYRYVFGINNRNTAETLFL